MKKYITITLIACSIFALLYAINFIYNNTSLIRGTNSEQIALNNDSAPVDNSILDLNTLVEKPVLTDGQITTGTFSKERSLSVPNGVEVSLFTYGLVKPRGIAFDDSNNLWIVDQSANSLYVVIDNDKDGFAEENLLVDSSLDSPHGLEYYLGDLYVGEKSQISVYRDITSEGTYSSKEIIVPDLPFDGHTSKTVRIGPDERLYVASGSSCNVCEESDPRRAAISVYNLDGSNHSIYASGLRNTVDFAFYGGKIWGVNNGRDQIGDDVPPEEVNIIEEGEHYGWPYCYGQGITNPEYPEKEDFCRNEAIGSTYDMQAHSAPLGMDFFPTNTSFPDSLNENMFIGFHGSWNRTVPTGYKIVRLNIFDRNAETINFITGWLDSESGEAWGRPVDIKFDHNGDMYISDDKAGVVYRVTYID